LSFSVGYLTARETEIWDLRRRDNSQSEIGRMLGVSRQAIHKAVQTIDEKVEQAFLETAETNKLDVTKMDMVEGIMEAYSPAHQLPVIVSLSKVNGLKIWYLYEGNCQDCKHEKLCRVTLEDEAAERGIEISTSDKLLTPSKLAIKIFNRYMEEH
jgi:predicted DNA-binding protein YlxM (UPF0122 family)